MKLSKKEIQHIAKLAQLDLSDKELKLYGGQLSGILGYIDMLKEVDTTSVEPTAQVTGLVNALREDEVQIWEKEETREALNEAPELKNGQVKVKRVLD